MRVIGRISVKRRVLGDGVLKKDEAEQTYCYVEKKAGQ